MAHALQLSTEHYDEIIGGSAVDPAVAEARGYRTLTGSADDISDLEEYGFGARQVQREDFFPALLIPMHNAHGEVAGHQVKPATPRSRMKPDGTPVPIKYETPKGKPIVLDIPPFTRSKFEDETASLWITEGVKKTDSLVSQGMAAIGLTGVYNWRNKQGTLGDWEDVPIKGRNLVLCFDADASSNRNVQQAMARLGAWLRSRGALSVKYIVVPGTVGETAVKGVDDYFCAGGTLADLAAAHTPTAPGQNATADASFTDAFLVEEAASEALEGRYCWSAGLGWLGWSGKIWREVSEVEPLEAVRQWASDRFDQVLAEQRKDPSKNLSAQISGWRGVLSKARLGALVQLSRGMESIQREATEFDADPDLLTVQNGTLHLPSGDLLPFDPTHSITCIADAEYKLGHTHPMWEKALTAVPPGIHCWYQDRLGQALTGYPVPDHQLVIAYGSGSNGKSTIVNTVRKMMGTYGVLISDRVLMASPDAHPTELMDLRGARYAVLEETPEARHLNVQRLKTTLGTEYIKARRIRQDPVEFAATHSLFINTNYRPVVTETDHGTWRRLSLLPFPYTFRKRESEITGPMDRLGDPALAYVHNDPSVRSAALMWMAAGAKAWYQRGRQMMENPEAVDTETRNWRAETDQILGFSDECLTFDQTAFTKTQDVLAAFNEWAADRGHRPWNDKTFGARFGAHDMIQGKHVTQGRKSVDGRQQRGWFGISVAKSNNPFN